ncbi:MAG: aspartate aminotransferase family protein [Actinobacteria bacterium]|nr:aspartate aminotransferase family protein [Actinomycetota bacterium]
MSPDPAAYDAALDRADAHARAWLAGIPQRPLPPTSDVEAVAAALGGSLPDGPTDPAEVIDLLARVVEPGLMSMGSGRFFGWVIGGTLPAALGADWLVSAWDQNAAIRFATPGVVGAEQAAGAWLLDLLGLPQSAQVAFVTGGTTANFAGLAAGRQRVLEAAGWDLDRNGLSGSPRVTVLAGADRHVTIDIALRYLGLGAPTLVEADDQGRIRPDALAAALATVEGPLIVALQAGNLHSGAFDAIGECADLVHKKGGWVHVDGAFGLWAATSPRQRHLVPGLERADSWATDAHKSLNTPYDCGVSIVRDPAALRAAFGFSAAYLIRADDDPDPYETVPEFSRRARGVPVWAALRSLGREGVAALVDAFVANAQAIAAGISEIPGAQVLNDVVYSQVCVAFESDERTRAVTERLLADGVTWMSGSTWKGRAVMRVSVSNWSTDDEDVRLSIDAVRRAAAPG